jgi:hypothetical protein
MSSLAVTFLDGKPQMPSWSRLLATLMRPEMVVNLLKSIVLALVRCLNLTIVKLSPHPTPRPLEEDDAEELFPQKAIDSAPPQKLPAKASAKDQAPKKHTQSGNSSQKDPPELLPGYKDRPALAGGTSVGGTTTTKASSLDPSVSAKSSDVDMQDILVSGSSVPSSAP